MGDAGGSALSEQVRSVVAKYSRMADDIGRALGLFTSPEKGRAAADEILRLR